MADSLFERVSQWIGLNDYPLLHLLLNERHFRWATLSCLAIIVLVPLSVIELLRVTPQAMRPEVKISAIDWFQSKALARKAKALPPDTEPAYRLDTWRLAIGNNPGDIKNNQAYLKTLVDHDPGRKHWRDAIKTGFWTLMLSHTNQTSLEHACLAFEHYGFDDLIVDLIDNYHGQPSEQLDRIHLRALFNAGNIEAFQERWSKADSTVHTNPSMALYRTAIDATSEEPERQEAAMSRIEAAKSESQTTTLAHRLQLFVSQHHRDLEPFQKSLNSLISTFKDTLQDHISYWDLLRQTGHASTARSQAIAFPFKPKTARQLVDLANAYTRLGLTDMALSTLKQHSPDYGFNTATTHAQASLLLDSQRWNELRHLAISMRTLRGISSDFIALSYFFEGKANWELGRNREAKTAFQAVDANALKKSRYGLYVGSNLWDLGYAEKAMTTLWPSRDPFRNDPSFWELMLQIANTVKDGSRMFLAAENLVRLAPDNLRYAADYASLLISQRIQIETALSMTFEALSQSPDNANLQVNYGHALVLSERYKEAESVLQAINQNHLSTGDLQGYSLAVFELYYRTGHDTEAQNIAKNILPEMLLPGDRKFFESMRDELNARSPVGQLESPSPVPTL